MSMKKPSLAALAFSLSLVAAPALARKGAPKEGKSMTLEEAVVGAEKALDLGAVGDASAIAERMHRTHGLTKDEQHRLDLIDARCDLAQGAYAASEKLFAKLHKAAPDDARITEWYARALDGAGKGETAKGLLTELADKDRLVDGDSYWTLAQLERRAGQNAVALTHAKLALKRPIALQSDELDREIHTFIQELTPKGK
jgi:tetratricopeptide (TPR) repeat protein